MKITSKFVALMAALAAGTAAAATTQTAAGTVIVNTATAEYTDPTDTTKTKTTTSNEVKTTVLPKPSFDIVYTDSTPDGNTYLATPASKTTTDAAAGQKVETAYSVVNSGNVALTVALAPVVGGDAVAADVKYYLATDTARATPITSVSLPVDDPATTGTDEGLVGIVQVITVPSAATTSNAYGASPEGSVAGTGSGTVTGSAVGGTSNFTGNGVATGTTVYEDGKAQGTDLQFAKVTVTTPALQVVPPTTKVTPKDPSDPTTPGPKPPTNTTPPTTYSPPTNPGVTNNPGTVITSSSTSNDQDAYPKADADANDDVVTFVSRIKNGGTVADTIYVLPTLPAGATSFKVLDKDGNVLSPETSGPSTGRYKLPGGPVAVGSSVEYQLVVTYPDSDSKAIQADIVTSVGIYSGNVPSQAAVTSKFTIHPPQMDFGDTDSGTAPTSVPKASNTPTETVDPSSATTNTTKNTSNDRSAVFPMTVKNNGRYDDEFTLVGSVDIVNKDGTTTTVAVKYYTAAGVALTGNKTPTIKAGESGDFLAVIDVPDTAAATNAANPAPKVKQTATGVYSTDSAPDNNDVIAISTVGKVGVAKFVAKTGAAAETVTTPSGVDITGPAAYTATGLNGAQPGDNISYRIIAKNTYNTSVSAFAMSDTVPANTTFVSVALNPASASKTIYKVGAGSWSATAPAAGLAAGTVIYVAFDNNNDLIPDALPSGSTLAADFVVKVK